MSGPVDDLEAWRGRLELATEAVRIVSPAVEDLERALASLDEENVTELTLGPVDRTEYLGVGGGNGRYVVYIAYDDNREFWNLELHERGEAVVDLTTGGQLGDFRAHQVVSYELARAALLAYAHSGERAPRLPWWKQR